ncbi:methylated-DNA--[protein]-cysteine S-methyltransferase [Corynebacterium halotolerans]|uniref:methylated-DNA--[protein]-cysteine S-methyltransferase n=1 Tax=Corynebacterium halotolerans TaxID=225326 RepID=UPI003CF8A618
MSDHPTTHTGPDIIHPREDQIPRSIQTDYPIAAQDLERLRRGLTRRATAQHLIDVSYHVSESPIGPLLLAATSTGLVRVAFEREGFETVLEDLAARLSPRLLESAEVLDPVATELAEYFAGQRRAFDIPLDRSLSAGFRLQVQQLLPEIGYGQTRSYREVAARAGNPKAVRAVGTACGRNPLPVVVPCHRVLRNDGSLGGYLGGLDAKRQLLALEKHTLAAVEEPA